MTALQGIGNGGKCGNKLATCPHTQQRARLPAESGQRGSAGQVRATLHEVRVQRTVGRVSD